MPEQAAGKKYWVMQALYQLVHSLAKEEKRLYNLHGRKSRFTKIYEGYLAASAYEKSLDRQIYAEHFSSFSKAFYSMQKNALLDDILAVLLEYSNSSRSEFNLTKLKSKYEVLVHKGFHDLALQYVKSAKDISRKIENHTQQMRVLEDYRDILSQTDSVTWDEYALSLEEIEELHKMGYTRRLIDEEIRKLNVLINGVGQAEENRVKYRHLSANILNNIKAIAQNEEGTDLHEEVFNCEFRYSNAFEEPIELHKRLLALEKKYSSDEYPIGLYLKVLNHLMENSMDVGDFLLINGLIYKTSKKISSLPEMEKAAFLPRFLELSSAYHFYENDITLAQKEIADLLALPGHEKEDLIKFYHQQIGILIAANLPRTSKEALDKLVSLDASVKNTLDVKLYELVIEVEMNNREEALGLIQKLMGWIRKSKSPRKYSNIRSFLDQLQKHLQKKGNSFQEIPGMETDWPRVLKLDLWLQAKIENSFYYNKILDYWQSKKQILNVA